VSFAFAPRVYVGGHVGTWRLRMGLESGTSGTGGVGWETSRSAAWVVTGTVRRKGSCGACLSSTVRPQPRSAQNLDARLQNPICSL
jgi:hypothetical protein